MGTPTRLGKYGVGPDSVDAIVDQLKRHGMTVMGEHQDLTLEGSRRVLTACF
jgi:NADP-dependent alcohol dehydrogenase